MKDEHILFTNDPCEFDDEYALVELRYQADDETAEFSDEEIEEMKYNMIADAADDFCGALEYANSQHSDWLVLADIGRWNGRYDGGKIFSDLKQAFIDMTDRCDWWTAVEDEDGKVEITTIHHDGRNYFQLLRLTESGRKFVDNNPYMNDRELHKFLLSYGRTEPANLRKLFGWI